MRRNSHHKVRFTDAVAPTIEGAWVYSPQLKVWEYVLWVADTGYQCMNEYGEIYNSTRPIEIEAISPVKVPGATPETYLEAAAYQRAVAGWNY